MSKELEALKRIGKFHIEISSSDKGFEIADTIDFDIIEKSLKALEIIKEKKIDALAIIYSKDYEDYFESYWQPKDIPQITREEYCLLKEILL